MLCVLLITFVLLALIRFMFNKEYYTTLTRRINPTVMFQKSNFHLDQFYECNRICTPEHQNRCR
jgi:hypothetical protein